MKVNIHLGNSSTAMQSMQDKKYGLAICDTEYGIGVAKMNMGLGKSKKCSKAKNRIWKKKEWDTKPPPKEYFNKLLKISENQIIWGGNYFDLGPTKGFIIWDKKIDEQLSFSQAEFAWTSFDRASKIFKHSVYKKDAEKIHPTLKPVSLYKWLLKNYGFNKDGSKRTIFDSHGGSFSIVIACIDMGFDIDIWEIDPDYYTDAVNRVKRHLSQLDLTREPVEINYIKD